MVTMTPEKRLEAAIHLEPVDRIPVAPKIETYAGKIAGITNAEFIFDADKALDSLDICYRELGGWDIYRAVYTKIYGPLQKTIGITRVKLPGDGLPPTAQFQCLEEEIMTEQDYDILLKQGFHAYNIEFWRRAHSVSEQEIQHALQIQADLQQRCIRRAQEIGMVPLYGGMIPFSLDYLSLCRSLRSFFKDLYTIPDIVTRALQVVTEEIIQIAIQSVERSGIPRIFVGNTRGSGTFISPKMFGRFGFPYLKQIVLMLNAKGVTPIFHSDSDWTTHLDFFRELPAKSAVLELDGSTDIFEAKRKLGGHLCLLGDVSATRLTLGTPVEVAEYCRQLITKIGKGGGFILGSGCEVPLTARRENVEVMLQSVEQGDFKGIC